MGAAPILWLSIGMGVAGIAIAWVSMLDAVLILEGAADRLAASWWLALIPCLGALAVIVAQSLNARHSPAVVALALAAVVLARLRPGPGLWLCSASLWFSALVLLTTPVGAD